MKLQRIYISLSNTAVTIKLNNEAYFINMFSKNLRAFAHRKDKNLIMVLPNIVVFSLDGSINISVHHINRGRVAQLPPHPQSTSIKSQERGTTVSVYSQL